MDESLEKLYTISLEGLAYMGKRKGDVLTVGMDHLSCFFPGMLALGAMQVGFPMLFLVLPGI